MVVKEWSEEMMLQFQERNDIQGTGYEYCIGQNTIYNLIEKTPEFVHV